VLVQGCVQQLLRSGSYAGWLSPVPTTRTLQTGPQIQLLSPLLPLVLLRISAGAAAITLLLLLHFAAAIAVAPLLLMLALLLQRCYRRCCPLPPSPEQLPFLSTTRSLE
jgi:hypothetical protein